MEGEYVLRQDGPCWRVWDQIGKEGSGFVEFGFPPSGNRIYFGPLEQFKTSGEIFTAAMRVVLKKSESEK
jgi:hypothetical protein